MLLSRSRTTALRKGPGQPRMSQRVLSALACTSHKVRNAQAVYSMSISMCIYEYLESMVTRWPCSRAQPCDAKHGYLDEHMGQSYDHAYVLHSCMSRCMSYASGVHTCSGMIEKAWPASIVSIAKALRLLISFSGNLELSASLHTTTCLLFAVATVS